MNGTVAQNESEKEEKGNEKEAKGNETENEIGIENGTGIEKGKRNEIETDIKSINREKSLVVVIIIVVDQHEQLTGRNIIATVIIKKSYCR